MLTYGVEGGVVPLGCIKNFLKVFGSNCKMKSLLLMDTNIRELSNAQFSPM